jgi:hypothetical protein
MPSSDAKVFVKRQGQVYTVFTDFGSGTPLPISNFEDQPPGSFPVTYNSEAEVKRMFPGRELVFIEREKKEQKKVPRVSADEIAAYLKEEKADKPVTKSPQKQESVTIVPQNGGMREKCFAFLHTLETARVYATRTNQRKLDLKIETIKDLIKDVFGE